MEFVGVTEIGVLLGVTRQRAGQLTKTDGFPTPVGRINAGRIWDKKAIEEWAKRTGRMV